MLGIFVVATSVFLLLATPSNAKTIVVEIVVVIIIVVLPVLIYTVAVF